MRTDHLTGLNEINYDLLPEIIKNEFEKIKFKFHINYIGVYLRPNLFEKMYLDIEYVRNQEELNKRIQFNENIKNSIDEYDEGFHYALYNQDFLTGIENENDKIIEVFSLIYNKYNSIDNPSILQFKNNYRHYNGLNFLQNHIYDYGLLVGKYIKSWKIILNNYDLFADIFNKYYAKKEIVSTSSNTKDKDYTFENNFSVLEWATIFYYADACKYFNQKNLKERQDFFMNQHNICTSKNTFKNKVIEVNKTINKTHTYSIDKLNFILPFITENYKKGVAKLENDIEFIKENLENDIDY